MNNHNLKTFLSRPVLKDGFIARNRRVLEKEYLELLRNKKWTGPVLIEITGTSSFWMYHDADDKVSGLQFYYGKDSFESLSCILFGLLSRQENTVYDIGGHCGIYSLIAAASGSKSIHYFDILNSVTNRFELNIKLNSFKNTSIFHINRFGLSCNSGEVEFNYNEVPLTSGSSLEEMPSIFSSSIARKGIATVSTLDKYWKENDSQDIGLIKIDVETHEEKVLMGGKLFFQKNKPHVLSEVLSTEQFYSLFSAFIKLGYHCAYEVNDDQMQLRRIHKNMCDSNGEQYIHCGQYHNVLFTEQPLSENILGELELLIKQSPNSKLLNEYIIR